jgi:hypothetical protein
MSSFNLVVLAAGASAMIGVAVAVIPRVHRRLAHSDLIHATHRPVMSVAAEACPAARDGCRR